jgi:ABC-2 type transport system permease protein
MSAENQAKGLNPPPGGEVQHVPLGSGEVSPGGSFSALCALTQRELSSLFYSPVAYVVGAVFLALIGYAFMTETLVVGNEASLRPLFQRMAGVLVFALPILTMRSIAEEFASGAIETLMTAPVTDTVVIFGKFLGAMCFYVVLLAATLPHLLLMIAYAEPVISQVVVGYLGLLLLGAMFGAIGIFASSCTRHQLLAAILGIAILALVTFVADYGAEFAGKDWAKQVCAYVNAFSHFSNFNKGSLDTGSLIYFVTGSVFFLFLATKVQESRRWR